MIYIDPPYNTGKDFIYKDSFKKNLFEYEKDGGQRNKDGARLVSNPETSGRFHSDWLSMMLPRLKLARNLLANNGVIFISIDDGEVANLRKLCDETFGENNFISQIIWHNSSRVSDYIAIEHEYVLVYAKNISFLESWRIKRKESEDILSGIKKIRKGRGSVEDGIKFIKQKIEYYRKKDKENKTKLYSWLSNYVNIDEDWQVYYPVDLTGEGAGPPRKFGGKLIPAPEGRHWMGQDYIDQLFEEGRIVYRNDRAYRKLYIQESEDNLKSIVTIPTRRGSEYLKGLLGKDIFDKPKPYDLVKHFAKFALGDCDIALDFFAGSATTAHAVMQLNAEDGGNRRFVMVQLPEICNEESEASKAGYKTISDIAKERIRRTGEEIVNEEHDSSRNCDVGFRVLKVDTSNMKDVYYTPDQTDQENLANLVDNIKSDRTHEDLLFQVLIDWGVDLALPISNEVIQNKKIFFVDGNVLIACFETSVTEELVKELADRKPERVVFRNGGFVSDSVKINAEQIFKQLSPRTDIKVI